MDIEKTIEFIIAQQAQFSVDLASQQAGVTRLEGNLTRLEGNLTRLEGTVERLAEENQAIAMAVHALLQGMQENRDAINTANHKGEERQAALRENIQDLTNNMNALIQVVDGLVRRSNGGSK